MITVGSFELAETGVRRRILADLVYFFVDGCTLNWSSTL